MKKKSILLTFLIIVAFAAVYLFFMNREAAYEIDPTGNYDIPKALFITTGTNSGNGLLPEGVIIAHQTFNRG